MMYDLPEKLDVCGTEYKIRSDYRAVLDICIALSDPDLNDEDKAFALMEIFYPDFYDIPQEHYNEAIQQCLKFINCGEERQEQKSPRLVDWEQDFKLIVSPVNRVMGKEIRAAEYLHWWSFVAAYYEIGDCLFAQVVRVREKKATGKRLDKSDRDFYKKNRHLVDLKTHYTQLEDELLKQWT